MNTYLRIIIIFSMILIGLGLSANNSVYSLVRAYVLHNDKLGSKLLRPMGVIVALSSVLLVIQMDSISLMINTVIILLIAFFAVRGSSAAEKEIAEKKERMLQEYQDEIKSRRENIAKLKVQNNIPSDSSNNNIDKKAKSVSDIKKEIWNDGSLTNKELIEGFGKK